MAHRHRACAPIDLQAFRPWEHAHRVHVPCQQNGNFINDRFAYGSASAMLAYQRARLLQLRKNCTYGEEATLAAMHAARIELAFSRVCVVRVRADGYVPDVDQAVMLGTIRARSWIHTINRLSPLLECNITASPSPLCTVNYHKEVRTRLAYFILVATSRDAGTCKWCHLRRPNISNNSVWKRNRSGMGRVYTVVKTVTA